MNKIKQLAGQTIIYGASTMISRLLNYFLVPLYTYLAFQNNPEAFGVQNNIYAYVAIIMVFIIHGMETAFFRFNEKEKDKQKVYATSVSSITLFSFFFLMIIGLFTSEIASWMDHPLHPEYVIWFSLIVVFDSMTAIPFARMRALNKARRFAILKISNIAINISLNLFYYLLCPILYANELSHDFISTVYDGHASVKYVFISNLISSGLILLILSPEIIVTKFKLNFSIWKLMMPYALPIMVFEFAARINETLDRILLVKLLPPDQGLFQLGIYGACYKISILMTIIIQAYKYAAEPFFFKQAKEKNAQQLYADVMNYFVIIVAAIFLGVMLYLDDVIIYFIGENYRGGKAVIPILLMANLFLGIFYNLSIWYKLTDRTMWGAYLALIGASITVVLNYLWIPQIGYMGSAWATFICYGVMMVLSYFIGQRYYHVPYNLKKILGYMSLSVGLFFVSYYLPISGTSLTLGVNTLIFFVFIGVVVWFEKPQKILR